MLLQLHFNSVHLFDHYIEIKYYIENLVESTKLFLLT